MSLRDSAPIGCPVDGDQRQWIIRGLAAHERKAMASGPQFRLLGPLEVRLDGSPVVLRAGKHRALLAALLLRPNRVVPVTELVEHVWGDAPPARTRGTLQTYVMRLRATLGDPS